MQEEGDRGCGGVAKTSAPGTMVGQVKECGAQLLEHLHTLSQEALDHADLQVRPASKVLNKICSERIYTCERATVVYKESLRPCWGIILSRISSQSATATQYQLSYICRFHCQK